MDITENVHSCAFVTCRPYISLFIYNPPPIIHPSTAPIGGAWLSGAGDITRLPDAALPPIDQSDPTPPACNTVPPLS